MEITSSVVLPVSVVKMAGFRDWVVETYVTYNGYMAAIDAPEMQNYIVEHLLPDEMKDVLIRSEPYLGARYGLIDVKRLLLNRKRILAKMKNVKGKVGLLAFPAETALARRETREAAGTRRLQTMMRNQQIAADYEAAYAIVYYGEFNQMLPPPPPPVPIPAYNIVHQLLSAENEETCMDGDCAICMTKHKMKDSCVVNCGHQFGAKCMKRWTQTVTAVLTCPLCRTEIKEITEFRSALIEIID